MAMLAKQGLGQCGTRERKEGKIKVTVAINRNGQSHALGKGAQEKMGAAVCVDVM
jgi:hypothetical protein